jgi:ABC-type sugar transport system ATPase subunit
MHFESELIILDELTNNLGVEETQGVLRFVRNARDSGHWCIFIAHNVYHVFQVVDRIVVMRRGKKVADDTIDIEAVECIITGMTLTASKLKAGFCEIFQLAAVARHIQHTESVSNEPGIAYRVTVKFRR